MNESDCRKLLVELDERGAIHEAEVLCESFPCSNDPQCQRYLGWVRFNQGRLEDAINWYSKAAAQGSLDALDECFKCVLLLDGGGDRDRALELCGEKPLSQYLPCLRYMAKTYFERGDFENTLRWSKKIAEEGGGDDLCYVGRLYLIIGKPEHSLEFLSRAISAGNVRAHQLMGEAYYFGLGVDKSVERARLHYIESAIEGYILSQVRLLHIEFGSGGFSEKVRLSLKLIFLIIKGLLIRLRDPGDQRIVDIPRIGLP